MRTLRDRLRAYHGGTKKESPSADPTPIPEKAPLGFVWRENAQGRYLFRRRTFSLEKRVGPYPLDSLTGEMLSTFARLTEGSDHPVEPQEILFFDTETTGLGTGAGTYVFLYGLGYYRDSTLVVEHYFLPDISQERALLQDFAEAVRPFRVLVTYNGKGFDWGLVETRYDFHRMPDRSSLPAWRHWDLLYPARRLWRHGLPSCRLSEVEAKCLAIRRQGDVPGRLAPALYFDYLRHHDLTQLDGVFRHNEQDLMTLVGLLAHLCHLIHGEVEGSPEERLAIGRWWIAAGKDTEAEAWLVPLSRENGLPLSLRREARRLLSVIWKRGGEWETVVPHWKRWLEDDPWSVYCWIELAKYYEHQVRDFEQALQMTQKALEVLGTKRLLGRAFSREWRYEWEDARKRERRLLKKLANRHHVGQLDLGI
ncbi:ribonuclease H-like domain-containing protein [Polycladomyces sp. WAk]|uniref:Ribonuclease H-like domain-containing protein n=1 Tax=Polycladomyces zharkentensis TaxID=2807616 RepID=A0ABS2WKU6_9BACL|nr:ribonuclease H-like domain-containing protein [Polycladomyces sp. WAk]MBN2909900.1 ribonuclease H-like domain-containing protein [Polycladomyces sp. WAk]